MTAKSTVVGARSANSSRTGAWLATEMPKSPCNAEVIHAQYCSGRLRSSRKVSLTASLAASEASGPSSNWAKSPGRLRTATKIRIDAPTTTARAVISLPGSIRRIRMDYCASRRRKSETKRSTLP